MKYLIDTDWVIDHLKGMPEVTERLEEFSLEGLAISVVSLAELYEGVYYSKNPEKAQMNLDEFLSADLTVIEVNQEIGQIFGKERGRLRRQKKTIGDFDLLIASTALRYDLTLLTNNKKHFKEVKGLRIISI